MTYPFKVRQFGLSSAPDFNTPGARADNRGGATLRLMCLRADFLFSEANEFLIAVY